MKKFTLLAMLCAIAILIVFTRCSKSGLESEFPPEFAARIQALEKTYHVKIKGRGGVPTEESLVFLEQTLAKKFPVELFNKPVPGAIVAKRSYHFEKTLTKDYLIAHGMYKFNTMMDADPEEDPGGENGNGCHPYGYNYDMTAGLNPDNGPSVAVDLQFNSYQNGDNSSNFDSLKITPTGFVSGTAIGSPSSTTGFPPNSDIFHTSFNVTVTTTIGPYYESTSTYKYTVDINTCTNVVTYTCQFIG